MILLQPMIQDLTRDSYESIIESIRNILQHLVGVKDWILWIDNAASSQVLYTSSINSESLLDYFQELVNNHRLSLTEGNYLSLTMKLQQEDSAKNQDQAVLILPICYESKLLGTIGLFSYIKSWGQTELSILQSLTH